MKLLIALFALSLTKAQAQDFEGTIQWSVKMSMSDPSLKGMDSPRSIIIKMKDGNSLMTTTETADTPALDALYVKSKDVTYNLDRKLKTYSALQTFPPTPGDSTDAPPEPVLTKTSETKKILGYNCTKYTSTLTVYGQTLSTQYWATTEIKDIDLKMIAKQLSGGEDPGSFEKVGGFPLQIETVTPYGKTITEVVSIKREPLKASDFMIPPGFKETSGY